MRAENSSVSQIDNREMNYLLSADGFIDNFAKNSEFSNQQSYLTNRSPVFSHTIHFIQMTVIIANEIEYSHVNHALQLTHYKPRVIDHVFLDHVVHTVFKY